MVIVLHPSARSLLRISLASPIDICIPASSVLFQGYKDTRQVTGENVHRVEDRRQFLSPLPSSPWSFRFSSIVVPILCPIHPAACQSSPTFRSPNPLSPCCPLRQTPTIPSASLSTQIIENRGQEPELGIGQTLEDREGKTGDNIAHRLLSVLYSGSPAMDANGAREQEEV